MRVTLKKGAALATALGAISLPLTTAVTISIFSDDDVRKLADAELAVLSERIGKVASINQAIYHIRALIGEANSKDISKLLTERALIDKQLAAFNPLFQPNVKAVDFDAITRKREALRTGQENTYRSADAISFPLFTNSLVETTIKQLKKQRIKLEDHLSELNFRETIELPDEVVELLTEFDLI
jgi:uncharacterized protein (DUF4213/DUF364 family)